MTMPNPSDKLSENKDLGVAASSGGRSGGPSDPSPQAVSAVPAPAANALVEFFNTPDGYRRFGHRGDYEGWAPEQTAAHFLAEYAALMSQADGGVIGLPATGTLRLCGYCRSWNSKPCGEQCVLSVNDPTWEQVTASAMSAGTAETPQAAQGRSPASATAEGRDAQPSTLSRLNPGE